MPRVGVRNRWLIAAPFCILILACAILGGIRWRSGLRVNQLQQATAAYERLEWPVAERHSREWLREHRDDDDALRVLSRSLFRQGRDQSAMAIQTRLDSSRVTAEDCFLRGQALVRGGQRENGILLWRQTLGLDANHIETLVALEQVFFQMDLLNEAARVRRASLVPARLAGSVCAPARAHLRRAGRSSRHCGGTETGARAPGRMARRGRSQPCSQATGSLLASNRPAGGSP